MRRAADVPPPSLGEYLVDTLAALHMSQATLARLTGMSTKHINRICNGYAGVSAWSALALERATGVDALRWRAVDAAREDYAIRLDEAV